jgi:hypothetical protein
VCGRQYLTCECVEHDHNLAIWKPARRLVQPNKAYWRFVARELCR